MLIFAASGLILFIYGLISFQKEKLSIFGVEIVGKSAKKISLFIIIIGLIAIFILVLFPSS
jgi:hypothetical protein